MILQWTLPAVLAGLLLLQAAGGRAQEGFPSTPPMDLPVRPFTLPKSEMRTLANGLKVLVAENHRVPLVTIRMAIRAGGILDPPESPGLAVAVARSLTSGTGRYNSLQLSEAAADLGGAVSVGAGDDFATASASALSENFDRILELLGDVLLRPAFPQNELEIYKSLTLQRLVAQRQNPGFLAGEQIAKSLYGRHPYGIVSTTAEAARALTREQLEAFYKTRYTPRDAVLVIVGDVKTAAALAKVESLFGSWSGEPPPAPTLPPLPARTARQVVLIARPGSVQSNLVLGNLAMKRGDPDFYALAIASVILGGSSGSRLFDTVREQKGYAYDVGARLDRRLLAGAFEETAETRTDVTVAALKEMLRETDRLRAEPVSAQELGDAKRFVSGNFVIGLTSQSGLADSLLNREVYHMPADYLTTFRNRINAVTAADVQRVAQKYITPDRMAIVVVGDAEKLRDGLKELGPLEEITPR